MNNDLISRSALTKDFQDRLRKAHNWKENALNRGDDEIAIRADATINFICEVIMTINNAPTVEVTDIENALLKKIYDELMATTNHWPEDLEDIFYKYLEERGMYNG